MARKIEPAALTNNTHHTPFVSIGKYASYSSTQEPYNPSPLVVSIKTTVKWTNDDFVHHTVTEGQAASKKFLILFYNRQI